MTEEFLPKIAAFLCWKWGYGACDMAGTIRRQYPASLRSVLVPCTARVDPEYIIRAFCKGADGAIVVGWLEGDCDYETGNILARRQVEYLKLLCKTLGLNEDRVEMNNMSSAEGAKFADFATEVTQNIQKIGPNPLKKVKAKKVA